MNAHYPLPELNIHNADCRDALQYIPDESVDLGIYDPPFGIGESGFDRHYNRDPSRVIPGYQEAPRDYEGYYNWTVAWLEQAKRILRPNGSMYVIMGHSNLRALLNAAAEVGLHEVNHLIWKYSFGVYTRKKYVTSHYHILYFAKSPKAKPTFNLDCRFGPQEVAYGGGKRQYQDLEDVFVIAKDNKPGQAKNQNKLPNALIQKMIQYSSNAGDRVCDFFMGNFTTAYVARRLGRKVSGFEINLNAYNLHMPQVQATRMCGGLADLPTAVSETPARQGEPITDDELSNVADRYVELQGQGLPKGEISKILQAEFQRGPNAIKNILGRVVPLAEEVTAMWAELVGDGNAAQVLDDPSLDDDALTEGLHGIELVTESIVHTPEPKPATASIVHTPTSGPDRVLDSERVPERDPILAALASMQSQIAALTAEVAAQRASSSSTPPTTSNDEPDLDDPIPVADACRVESVSPHAVKRYIRLGRLEAAEYLGSGSGRGYRVTRRTLRDAVAAGELVPDEKWGRRSK